MSVQQIAVFLVLGLSLALFLSGRWRYDLVALLALLSLVLSGIVSPNQAFVGFGHAAVITVAAVLVISRGLRNSGVVDRMASLLFRIGDRPFIQISALTATAGILSGFINNVGALALLLPVTLELAHKHGRSPSLFLMPLAFASLLGGMTTLIGTPPNIIVAGYRAEVGGTPFGMFDFSPVGVGILITGILFIVLIGWRLVPARKGRVSAEELLAVKPYMTEVRLLEESPAVGRTLVEQEDTTEDALSIVALVRHGHHITRPSRWEVLQPGDILVVEGDSGAIKSLVDQGGMELVGGPEQAPKREKPKELGLIEAVVQPGALIEGRNAKSLRLRRRYEVSLLAVARQGRRLKERLNNVRFQSGDVLLFQGAREQVMEAISRLGCLPLAPRELSLGKPRRVLLALLIFIGAIAATASGLVPVAVALLGAAVLMVLWNFLSLREVYESVDWPIIVLLAAMIPVGEAMETTGGAQQIAVFLAEAGKGLPLWATLALVTAITMTLSDLINNAAVAVLMCPIALNVAQNLSVSPDPFLMGVAVGASCAFLTPIGHQSNTLVLGPGGYEFGDYWRMGLPLEILVLATSTPLILYFWQ